MLPGTIQKCNIVWRSTERNEIKLPFIWYLPFSNDLPGRWTPKMMNIEDIWSKYFPTISKWIGCESSDVMFIFWIVSLLTMGDRVFFCCEHIEYGKARMISANFSLQKKFFQYRNFPNIFLNTLRFVLLKITMTDMDFFLWKRVANDLSPHVKWSSLLTNNWNNRYHSVARSCRHVS